MPSDENAGSSQGDRAHCIDGAQIDTVRAHFTRFAETVVRNAKIDYLRRCRPYQDHEYSIERVDDVIDATTWCDNEEFSWPHLMSADLPSVVSDEWLSAALSRLNDRERELVFLMFYRDLPIQDVADSLGMTKGAAYRAKSRLLGKLRTYRMNEEDGRA